MPQLTPLAEYKGLISYRTETGNITITLNVPTALVHLGRQFQVGAPVSIMDDLGVALADAVKRWMPPSPDGDGVPCTEECLRDPHRAALVHMMVRLGRFIEQQRQEGTGPFRWVSPMPARKVEVLA